MSLISSSSFTTMQEKKLRKLAKKCGTVPENLPTILQNPDIVTLILKYLKGKDTDDEMPALLFDWNQAGFNDTNVPNCRNGVAGQTQGAIIANLLANGAIDFMNLNILFVFQNGQAIGTWHKNVAVNLPWVKHQAGVPDICNNLLRLNKITAHTANVDIEDFSEDREGMEENTELKSRIDKLEKNRTDAVAENVESNLVRVRTFYVVDPRNLEKAITGAKRIEAGEYYGITTEKETKNTSLEGTIAELTKQMQELAANYAKLITTMTSQAGLRMRNRVDIQEGLPGPAIYLAQVEELPTTAKEPETTVEEMIRQVEIGDELNQKEKEE
ncbi:1252_t:CDS:2, partial [Acaulospora morrowiae]